MTVSTGCESPQGFSGLLLIANSCQKPQGTFHIVLMPGMRIILR